MRRISVGAAIHRCLAFGIIIGLASLILAAAQPTTSTSLSVRSGRWSDPEVWHAGRLPVQGDAVIINENTHVLLDRNVSVASLVVSGSSAVLSCLSTRDLTVPWDDSGLFLDIESSFLIEKGGCFSCGAGNCQSEPEQYAGKLTIRLRSEAPPISPDDDIRTLLVRDGGSLYLSGRERSPAITRLASDVRANALSIVVSDAGIMDEQYGWKAGDLIAIAPTDYAPSETEYRRITSLSITKSLEVPTTATLQLDSPLAYAHNGRRLEIPGSPNGAGPFVVDTRAEVALLSRNIVIEGVAGDPSGLGGDVKILGRSSRVFAKWCELRFLGRRGHLGRYPLHLHGAAEGALITGVSVHDSYQRGVVLHCTNGARVSDTVVAGVYGFAFMLEDGAEENNVLLGNLALDVLNAIPNTTGSVITEHGNPAGYWFVNPANSFVGNMAAGIHGSGFSWEMLRNRTASYTLCPQEVPGYDVGMFTKQQFSALDASVYGALMRKNFAAFRNNSAHSMHSGIWFQNAIDVSSRVFFPRTQSLIEGFVAWKLSPRKKAPPGVALSHHDSCIHAFGISRLKFSRTVCLNSPRIYWSSDSNLLNDTLAAWIGSEEAATGGLSLMSDDEMWRFPQTLISYTNPQTFVNTHMRGKYGRAIFQAMGFGSINSANSIMSGFSFDPESVTPNFELALVSSQSPHVFTDRDGTWLGAGQGARVLASCPECGTSADPIIEVYAPGACLPVGKERSGSSVVKEYVSDPRPGIGGVIKGLGATPILCAGPEAPRFSVLQLRVRSVGEIPQPPLDFQVFVSSPPSLSGNRSIHKYLRDATQQRDKNSAFFLAPMTPASTSPSGGYRIVSPSGWTGIRTLIVSMGPMADFERGGMTIVLAGIQANVRYSVTTADDKIFSGLVSLEDTTTAGAVPTSSCAALVFAACASLGTSSAPCVCRDPTSGDLHVRFVGHSGSPDPTMFDSKGDLYLFQSASLQLSWGAESTASADAQKEDFAQLTQYLGIG